MMPTLSRLAVTLCALAPFFPRIHAQSPSGKPYTDPTTNITFSIWEIPDSSGSGSGQLTFGLALPPNATSTNVYDFLGYLHCDGTSDSPIGWCGISLGGAMTNSLLLVAYPDTDTDTDAADDTPAPTVKHTLRYTTEYKMPEAYTGNATVSVIHSEVLDDSSGFTMSFLCVECLRWGEAGSAGGARTSEGSLDLAWALGDKEIGDRQCADEAVLGKHSAQGTWVAFVDGQATSERYDGWTAQAVEGAGMELAC